MELPYDVLAIVFRRLAPRSLAASRCVCKAWRDVIDAGGLLRADLLPHSVLGIFIKYELLDCPTFLSRPSTAAPNITSNLHFTLDRPQFAIVLDHCNGVLLYRDECGIYVLNPATQQRACLPPPSCGNVGVLLKHIAHLVFDPAESPHYQVFLVPDNSHREKEISKEISKCLQAGKSNTASASITSGLTPQQLSTSSVEGGEQLDVLLPVEGLMEWPALTWELSVFSSRTGRWEERAFTRERKEAGTTTAEQSFFEGYAVYWLGALYVQCNDRNSMIRISLSNDKYRVIEMPPDQKFNGWLDHSYSYLGKSPQGVSLASFHDRFDLWIWVLDESRDQIEWVLRHKIDLVPTLCALDYREQTEGPWILHDFNTDADGNIPAVKENSFEWDSDNDDVIVVDYEYAQTRSAFMGVLGFHPYKDVIFLNLGTDRAVAFHLNSLMIQHLGNLFPNDYDEIAGSFKEVVMAFPYTPCLMDFAENNSGGYDQDQHHLL